MSTSNILTTDFTIRLHDGRTMGVASVGRSDGLPIFHCHGSGSSRLEVNLLAEAAATQGVRLIGLDRPGIGRSYQFAICCIKNGAHSRFHTITEAVFQQASTASATHQSDCHIRLEAASMPLVPIWRSFHCARHFTAA